MLLDIIMSVSPCTKLTRNFVGSIALARFATDREFSARSVLRSLPLSIRAFCSAIGLRSTTIFAELFQARWPLANCDTASLV